MKSLKTTAKQTPKATIAVVITAILGIATLFIDSSEVLGVSTSVVKWISFGVSALTFVMNTLINNVED